MSASINNPLTGRSYNIYKRCLAPKSTLPPFKPFISDISVKTSVAGQYSLVYINGLNFLSQAITYVNFGTYTNLPITYYGSYNISFVVPLNAMPGQYNIVVVNIYNGQLSTPISYTYAGNFNYSNPVVYTLT
jgi:hypothetical protein